ncbi:MAG: TolB family protein [Anaerolineae bacterium]
MNRIQLHERIAIGCWLLITAVFLVGCQPKTAEVETGSPQTETPAPVIPTATKPIPSPTASSNEPTVEGLATRTPADGRLIMIDESQYPNHKLVVLDLETQTGLVLFEAPENGWMFQLDVDQSAGQIAISYAPPPESDPTPIEGRTPFDRNGVYIADFDETGITSNLKFLFGNSGANEFVFNPIWSADGRSIFYVSYKRILADITDWESQASITVALYRYDLETDSHNLISDDGIWPRISADGEKLLYIQVDPVTSQRSIRTSDLDGGNIQELVPFNRFFDIDTPTFSADGKHIYFAAVPHSTKVERKWWEVVLGIQGVSAHVDHNIPSDWWRVSVEGGEPEKVASVQQIISHGSFDASGEILFYATDSGVFQLPISGSNPEPIPIQNRYRYVEWAP